MAMYRSKEGLIIDAVRFDPSSQIVMGLKRWPDEAGYQPRDMSWGYLDTNVGRQHVHVSDWIGKDRDGSLYVYTNETFLTHFKLYKEVPQVANPDMTLKVQVDTTELQFMLDKLKAQFPEERIRAIVREEIFRMQQERQSERQWQEVIEQQKPTI